MDIKIQRTLDYIPSWNKNKEASSPITFKLKHLTTDEFNSCYNITPLKLDIKGKKIGGGEVTVDKRKMFVYGVMEIKGLTVTDESEKQTKIVTPTDLLLSPGLEDLFFEVIGFIRGMEARIDSKN